MNKLFLLFTLGIISFAFLSGCEKFFGKKAEESQDVSAQPQPAAPKKAEKTKDEFIVAYADVECSLAKEKDTSKYDEIRIDILKRFGYDLNSYIEDKKKFGGPEAEKALERCMPEKALDPAAKVKYLDMAVKFGCLEKKEKDTYRLAGERDKIFKEYSVAPEEYGKNVERLKTEDREFAERLAKSLEQCPGAEVKLTPEIKDKVFKTAVDVECVKKNAKPEELVVKMKEVFAKSGLEEANFQKMIELFAKEDPVVWGTLSQAVEKACPKEDPRAGKYEGVFKGGNRALQMHFTVHTGGRVDGSMNAGSRNFSLSGAFDDAKRINIMGKGGNDYLKCTGLLSGKHISGSCNGSLETKVIDGSWSANKQ